MVSLDKATEPDLDIETVSRKKMESVTLKKENNLEEREDIIGGGRGETHRLSRIRNGLE